MTPQRQGLTAYVDTEALKPLDVEGLLVSRVLDDRNLPAFLETGIRYQDLADPLHSKVYRFISEHADKYGEVPNKELVAETFPNYQFLKADLSHAFYSDKFKGQKLNVDIRLALDEALAEVESDADFENGLVVAGKVTSRINDLLLVNDPPKDFNLAGTGEERWQRYLQIKERDGALLGIPTGFPIIDLATGGLQPEQMITFTGLPKAGKSTILMLAAIAAHAYNCRVMFITFEMSNNEMQMRHDSARAGVSHKRLTRGELTPVEERALQQMYHQVDNMNDFIFVEDISARTRLSQIQAKVEEVDPDVVFIDGAYLLEDESGDHPQGSSFALTNISRGIKRLAQRTRKPVVISHQSLHSKTPKSGLVASSMGYSSGFAQDSDVVLGVERPEPIDPDMPLAFLKIIISRNCGPKKVKVLFDYDTGQFRELGEADDEDE